MKTKKIDLNISEYDDKTYSDELQKIHDSEYSVGSAINAVASSDKKGLLARNLSPQEYKDYLSKGPLERAKIRYKLLKKEKEANVMSGFKDRKQEAKEAIAEKRREAQAAKEAAKKAAKKADFKKRNPNLKAKSIATGAVGAVGGGLAGNAIATKWRKELAVLQAKKDKTPQDLDKMKVLKRKIMASRAVGSVAGGALGYVGGRQLMKK